jgi:hypothetical protein
VAKNRRREDRQKNALLGMLISIYFAVVLSFIFFGPQRARALPLP